MNANKLAILFASTGENPQEHQAGLENIRAFIAQGLGPFEEAAIITGEGLDDVNIPEIKNHCLDKAVEAGAGWCLVMDPVHRLAPESPKLLKDAFAQFQGIWGLYATCNVQNADYNIRMPQILTMELPEDLLLFDPQLTLHGPFFVRTDAAQEVRFDPRQNIAWDLDFALRFWPGHRTCKKPTLIGGVQAMSESKVAAFQAVSQELIVKQRQKRGLLRENTAVIQRTNEKIHELQGYCRSEQAIPADKVPELTRLLPYRGLMDINLNEQLGFQILNMNDDQIANQMAWTGTYRRLATTIWSTLVMQNPGLVLDCGAYNGLFGLIAAVCSPQSHVICIEPEREAFARIQISLQANNINNISNVQYALDATAGIASLYRLVQQQGLCQYAAIHPRTQCPLQDAQLVHTIPLDNLLLLFRSLESENAPKATVIKMNLCGNEAAALMGSVQTLENMHPAPAAHNLSDHGHSNAAADSVFQRIRTVFAG